MGLFDEIEVKQDLPVPEEIKNLHDWKNYKFQTKDLDNTMSLYYINEYRELVEKRTEREYVPYTDEDRKIFKPKPWNLWKEVIEGETTYVDTKYHGTLRFYTYEHLNDEEDFSLDFNAYFIYGKLDKIELAEYSKSENYLINNQRIKEERARQEKRPWNRFKKFASLFGWRWFWRKACKFIYLLENACSKTRYFILKNF
jgi:hypothetical protein